VRARVVGDQHRAARHWVAALNDRFDYLQHLLLAPTPAPADTHAPMPRAGKKHGQH